MLIYPGVAALDVVGPLQVFEHCNRLASRFCYEIHTVAAENHPVPAGSGIAFLPTSTLHTLPTPIDTLLVPGAADPGATVTTEILGWLRCAAPRARRFGSVGTGASVLAAAGLGDGRENRLPGSGGGGSGIGLALALVEEDHGSRIAHAVARALDRVLKPSGGAATPAGPSPKAPRPRPSAIQKVQDWCLSHLAEDLGVRQMARRAAMSERSFVRAFRQETGTTPAAYVADLRLSAVCDLMRTTRIPPVTAAVRCGLSNTAMRRAFLRAFGLGPAQYRARFSACPSLGVPPGGRA